MKPRTKICVVTGSRAEYGLLYWVMKELQQDASFELRIAVTGMHLSPVFGSTYQAIERDGFRIDEKVETLVSGDTPAAIAKSIGLGTIGFAEVFSRSRPDLMMILGDRFELLAAAQAALIAKIPIAHLAGGDTTEGAFDEAIRHSLTKMSHLHFVTNEDSAKRVKQLGENPDRVFNVGSPGIDAIRHMKRATRKEVETFLGFPFRKKNLLITFHPVTLESNSAEQFQALLDALHGLGEDVGLIFTRPNSDTEGLRLIRMLEQFVESHANATVHTSLDQHYYLNTVAQVNAVVGNSSSGLYEVPSFQKPTVNIGDRQKGRLQAVSVLQCAAKTDAISEAIRKAFVLDCSAAVNPYGDGHSAPRILKALKGIEVPSLLLKKGFFDLKS
jgi:UDP-hydrolysing UDP-N-acetyl-D-glucosamine 2-epimerase